MTRLKPEHAQDDILFEKLAALTNLTCIEFRKRYGYLVEPTRAQAKSSS